MFLVGSEVCDRYGCSYNLHQSSWQEARCKSWQLWWVPATVMIHWQWWICPVD